MQQHFSIMGSARYLPRRRITAEELDTRLGLPSGWTLQHTGVAERFEARDDEGPETMGREVVFAALRSANMSLREIDLIIDASLSLQQPIPCNAALLKAALGPELGGIPAIDVHASCLGFLAALQVVNGLFAVGAARRILVSCVETPLRGVNWAEPESACLMGDGAAAFIFEAAPPRAGAAFRLQTFSEGVHHCEVKGGGHRQPPFDYTEGRRSDYLFHMEGGAVHKLASQRLPPMVAEVLVAADCALHELEIVPHQASGPAIEFMARRLGINRNRLHASLAHHGNLVAAGIPYVLHQVRATKPPGTRVMIVGTAAGYTQGAAIFTL